MAGLVSKDSTSEYCRQLDALQKIRTISGGNELDLPQICVVGDQSSGKSSLLAELTGIHFPVNSGICTRAPIVVECKLNAAKKHDVYEIEKEDSFKEVPQPQDLAKEITAMQNSAVLKGDSPSKISTKEIRVRVCGPGQINIIVIDLPGIIHNGPGTTETKDLIDNYIAEEQTLILLVSEAKQDDEGCAAIGMAQEWDEDAMRTLRVFTKCDTWDSDASKQRLVERMGEQDSHDHGKLLPHAVICRMHGDERHDPETEVKELEAMGIPQQRAGVAALKDRLPSLYAELIHTNLPALQDNIQSKIQQTKDNLREVGEEARSGDAMLRECQTVLVNSCVSKLQEPISDHLQELTRSICATEAKVTKLWSDGKLRSNAFECPFFQGGPALQSCMKEITDWWRPIMMKYVEEIEQVARNHVLHALQEQTQGIPHALRGTIHQEWNTQCCRLISELRRILENRLHKEISFGTVNCKLTSQFNGEDVLPDNLIGDIVFQMRQKYLIQNSSESGKEPDAKRRKAAIEQTPKLEISEDQMREELVSAKRRWSAEFEKEGLHAQQQQRLFHAIKAVWAVEHKTFTDYILKETTENLLEPRSHWVSTDFFSNVKIKEAAVEDPAHQQRRQELKDKKERMEQCMAELESMKPKSLSF